MPADRWRASDVIIVGKGGYKERAHTLPLGEKKSLGHISLSGCTFRVTAE
jgi:hypothetical protein